ncbi:bacteriocin-like protein [Staphylococcus auricularis]|nr:bacteriocin [Staphylococcus auricularis]MBM0868723.1 bacteriocin [Staphylococcus auricularis]MCG7340772.1 bacteriocin [Staphylococcus auricularis]
MKQLNAKALKTISGGNISAPFHFDVSKFPYSILK